MRILTITFCLITSLLHTQDNKANQILSNLSKKTASYSSIEAHFTNTFSSSITSINESQTGVLFLQGDAYKLDLAGQSIISDGETNWMLLKEDEEVNISEVEEDDEDIMNPSKIFTMYEEGYKSQFIKEEAGKYYIHLFPKEKGSFSRIELVINKGKMQIEELNMFDKQSSKYSYVISKFKTNKVYKESFFSFEKEKYPDFEIIDLR